MAQDSITAKYTLTHYVDIDRVSLKPTERFSMTPDDKGPGTEYDSKQEVGRELGRVLSMREGDRFLYDNVSVTLNHGNPNLPELSEVKGLRKVLLAQSPRVIIDRNSARVFAFGSESDILVELAKSALVETNRKLAKK